MLFASRYIKSNFCISDNSTLVRVCDNQLRRDHISQFCQTPRYCNPTIDKRHIFVIDNYKLIYCDIPKVGSSSFKALFRNIVPVNTTAPKSDYLQSTGFRAFHTLNAQEQNKVIKDYFKLIVLRHPLDRLRSALNDRLLEDGSGQENYRRNYQPVIKPFLISKGLTTEEEFDREKDKLNLEQFFELVAQNRTDFHNIHWESFWNLCEPCRFNYDLIIKLETVDSDIDQLYAYLRSVNRSVPLPKLSHRRDRLIGETDKLRLISELVKDIQPKIMEDIMNFLQYDLLFGGYTWDRKHGAKCNTGKNNCC